MKHAFLLTIAVLGLLAAPSVIMAQSKPGKIIMAYTLALGRGPTAAEGTYWMGQPEKSLSDYTVGHKSWLQGQAYEAEQVIRRGYFDAFGFQPDALELKYWMNSKPTYAELFSNNLNFMNGQADNQKAKKMLMINASYQNAFGRNADQGELNYWMSQPTIAYGRLTAIHQTYKNTNSKNQVTCGATLGPVSTFAVSRPLADQCQGIAGGSSVVNSSNITLVKPDKSPLISQDGGGLVASGGGNLVASGGGNLVASGGGNLVASGGGNMVSVVR